MITATPPPIPAPLLTFLQETVPGIQIDPVQDAGRTLTELGLDSLDKMSLLLAVQEHYQVEFTEPEIKTLRTLQDIADKISP